jgi:hypothetical protein
MKVQAKVTKRQRKSLVVQKNKMILKTMNNHNPLKNKEKLNYLIFNLFK